MRESKNTLIGKTVMSDKGIPIGIITNSLVDAASGKTTSLLLDPCQTINASDYKQNKHGEIVLPARCVCPVQDVMVFEQNSL